MRLGKNQIRDLVVALEIAQQSEEDFWRGHIEPHTDGQVMDGYEGIVRSTKDRIRRFGVLRDKLRDAALTAREGGEDDR